MPLIAEELRQLGVPFYDVKGIRSDSTHSNYNGAPVTGVAKKEERWRVEVQRRAVDLDAECFGVQPPAVGPWQRALQAAGGVRPLVFGQYAVRRVWQRAANAA